jgi:hypothetical protein
MDSSSTFIDDGLAKGLASRFLSECADNLEKMEAAFHRHDWSSTTKKGWLKKQRATEKLISKVAFRSYWIGSKSKPALGFVGLSPQTSSFKSWQEKTLSGYVILEQFNSNAGEEPYPIPFVISHHALARLIQRCEFLRTLSDRWSYHDIVKLLEPLPAWSAFWCAFITGIRFENAKRINAERITYRLYPVIPSKYGLFFCECSDQNKRVSLRTFVSTSQLRADQAALREFLLQVEKGFDEFPLELHPYSYFDGLFETDVLLLLMRERLLTRIEFVKSFILKDVDDTTRANLDKLDIYKSYFTDPVDHFAITPQEFLNLAEELRKKVRE